MSVFIPDVNGEGIPGIRRARKKYHTKYNAKYKEDYPWALPSSKGELYAYCQLCSVDISIKSVGAKGLRDHEATCRHSQKAHEIGFRPMTSSVSVPPLVPRQNCFDHPTNNVSVNNNSSINTFSAIELAVTCSPSRVFNNISLDKDETHNPMVSMINQTSLLSATHPSTLTSTSYPVLEAVEGEMQSTCRSPETPQTPNTPSTPLHQEHYVHKLIPASTNTLHTLSNAIVDGFQSTGMTHDSLLSNNRRGLICPSVQPHQGVEIPSTVANEVISQRCVKRSESPSVEDLTCSICSKVFHDWKALKQDLMNHIKDANSMKKEMESPKDFKEDSKRKLKRQGKPNRENSLENRLPSTSKRKRGRPPGKKKKSSNSSHIEEKSLAKTEDLILDIIPSESAVVVPSKSEAANVTKLLKKKRGRPTKKKQDPLDLSDVSVDTPSSNDNTFCSVGLVQDTMIQDHNKIKNGASTTTSNRRSAQIQCRVCRAMYYSRQDLKDHYQLEHNNGRPYWCEICEKCFTTKNNLEVHKKHKHFQGPNPCLCTICCKVLSSRTNLKIHMMIHKGERPFSCPVCSKSFSRKANMEMHMVYHTGERRYTCEICGQSFFAINALKRHKKLHTGEREYKCDVCGASYVTGTDLRRHLLKHEAVKPFPCTICEKQFTRSHDLKVHLRYHNKEVHFTCSVCCKQFVESGNYRRHMRRHTGERPYTCAVCQQSFSQVHHYKVHVRTNHADQADNPEWNSSLRPSTHRNPSLNQRSSPSKRTQKTPVNPSSNVTDPVISHQMCPSTVTSTTAMTNTIPEHVHNVHTVHIHNTNNPSMHNHTGTTTIANLTPITSSVVNMSDMHNPNSVTATAAVPHVPMMSSHHSQVSQTPVTHHPTGFIQYNSYIYNTGVISPYPPLFDMCPQ